MPKTKVNKQLSQSSLPSQQNITTTTMRLKIKNKVSKSSIIKYQRQLCLSWNTRTCCCKRWLIIMIKMKISRIQKSLPLGKLLLRLPFTCHDLRSERMCLYHSSSIKEMIGQPPFLRRSLLQRDRELLQLLGWIDFFKLMMIRKTRGLLSIWWRSSYSLFFKN